MTPAEHYRRLAAELQAKARHEADSGIRQEWVQMALAYLRLAEQADRNSENDVVYEAGWRPKPPRPTDDPA